MALSLSRCFHSSPLSLYSTYSWRFSVKCLPCVCNLLYSHSSPLLTWAWSSWPPAWIRAIAWGQLLWLSSSLLSIHLMGPPTGRTISAFPLSPEDSHMSDSQRCTAWPYTTLKLWFLIASQPRPSVPALRPTLTFPKHTMLFSPFIPCSYNEASLQSSPHHWESIKSHIFNLPLPCPNS